MPWLPGSSRMVGEVARLVEVVGVETGDVGRCWSTMLLRLKMLKARLSLRRNLKRLRQVRRQLARWLDPNRVPGAAETVWKKKAQSNQLMGLFAHFSFLGYFLEISVSIE